MFGRWFFFDEMMASLNGWGRGRDKNERQRRFQAQRFEIDDFGLHADKELTQVVFYRVGNLAAEGRIQNLVKPENVVVVFSE